MKIQTERDNEFVDTNRIVIKINNIEFRITVNKSNELFINKFDVEGDSNIRILPSASNEIKVV